jgi:hypothetical protein
LDVVDEAVEELLLRAGVAGGDPSMIRACSKSVSRRVGLVTGR